MKLQIHRRSECLQVGTHAPMYIVDIKITFFCMHFIWVYSCIGPNAFDILMSASVRPSLPRRVTRVTNKKQQLRNDIIDYLEVHNLTWCAQQVATEGERFVACLVDLMWYIDGHHEVFQHRSNAIPSSVSQFSGYNIPELSKHRKRSLQNMSSPILNDHANNIFKCLQGSYWMTNSRWNSWKGDLESLATSVSNYIVCYIFEGAKFKDEKASFFF